MSNLPDVLWLNTSPSLKRFDRRLLAYLSQQVSIAQWEYSQTQDEATSLDVAVTLLHDYLKTRLRPIHLVGHSNSGLLGLIYARKHPERVQSLVLLSVGAQVAVDWQAHYYVQRQLLPCSRQIVLSQMVLSLFGNQSRSQVKGLANILEQDLDYSPSPHSLWQRASLPQGGVSMPLMVCGSKNDTVVDSRLLQEWRQWLKAGDYLWECHDGYHFFHHFYPQAVGEQILKFWRSQTPDSLPASAQFPVPG